MSARHATGVDAVPLARVMARIVAVALIGLVPVGMGWLLWPHETGVGAVHAAPATVVQSAICGPSDGLSDARDVVRVALPEDREVLARLDGCGHRLGEVLTVEVPDPLPKGELLVSLVGTGVPTPMAAGRRLGAVGIALASVAGALLMWRLRGGWKGARRRVTP